MRVLVGGYWDPKRAKRFKPETRKLGKLLARGKHDIIAGPGSGVVRYLLEGYTSVKEETRGQIIFYLPHPKEMVRVGDGTDEFADKVVETNLDYLERTVQMVKQVDAFASIAGASGTIFEAIAMMFLKKPVVMLEEAGAASNAGQILGGLKAYAYFAPTVERMVEYLGEKEEDEEDHVFDEPWYNV